MESPMTLSHMTLSDLERSNSRSLRFRSLISCKGARPYVTMKEVCRKLPLVPPIAGVKQSAKVHGPLVPYLAVSARNPLTSYFLFSSFSPSLCPM